MDAVPAWALNWAARAGASPKSASTLGREVGRVRPGLIGTLPLRDRILEMVPDLGQDPPATTRGDVQTGGQLRDVLIDLTHAGLTPNTWLTACANRLQSVRRSRSAARPPAESR